MPLGEKGFPLTGKREVAKIANRESQRQTQHVRDTDYLSMPGLLNTGWGGRADSKLTLCAPCNSKLTLCAPCNCLSDPMPSQSREVQPLTTTSLVTQPRSAGKLSAVFHLWTNHLKNGTTFNGYLSRPPSANML